MSEATHRKRLGEFTEALICAGRSTRSIKWKRFVPRKAIIIELERRGYRLTQDTPGRWFAEPVEGGKSEQNG